MGFSRTLSRAFGLPSVRGCVLVDFPAAIISAFMAKNWLVTI
jgi:hypothetical protein